MIKLIKAFIYKQELARKDCPEHNVGDWLKEKALEEFRSLGAVSPIVTMIVFSEDQSILYFGMEAQD